MTDDTLERVGAFLDWTKQKIAIDHRPSDLYFYEREIWWACLGQNVGSEENGKHQRFERPVIILKKFGRDLFFGIPVTTKIKDGSWYFHFHASNETRCALLTQLRLMSRKRLLRRIGVLGEPDFEEIRKRTRALL